MEAGTNHTPHGLSYTGENNTDGKKLKSTGIILLSGAGKKQLP